MEAKITKKTDKYVLILWNDADEFGNLRMEYTGNGKYEIDSEYIGIDKLINILRNV